MAVYWLSFKIKDVSVAGRSADKRRDELYSVIEAASILGDDPSSIWKDTTSFVVFKSKLSIREIADAAKSIISQRHDTFLLRTLDRRSALICGNFENESVFGFMLSDSGATYLKDITDFGAMSEDRQINSVIREHDDTQF